jgi:hypothetical protein
MGCLRGGEIDVQLTAQRLTASRNPLRGCSESWVSSSGSFDDSIGNKTRGVDYLVGGVRSLSDWQSFC